MDLQLPILIHVLAAGACACAAFVAFELGHALAGVRPLPRPVTGLRGQLRTEALGGAPAFALVEPALRWIGACLQPVHSARLRHGLDQRLLSAGQPLGLSADEALAIVLLSGWGATALATVLCVALAASWPWVAASACAGLAWPVAALRARTSLRVRTIERALPATMDLLALAVSAGADLPRALGLIVESGACHAEALRRELELLRCELELGRTRAQALRGLAERVPSQALAELVAAVVQAEVRGTPLAEVLRIQAGVSRARRSVLAEEAAARAGVLMMVPLMLLLACVLVVTLGAMVLRGMEAGA